MAGNKSTYARRGREMATGIALQLDELLTWRNVYWDRAYNATGADELTDADVADLGITAADVTGLTTFADAFETFMASNRPYLSKMRSDI